MNEDKKLQDDVVVYYHNKTIRWLDENEETYTKWLTSVNDDHERLKWYKWTFQAKNSILNEFIRTFKRI